MTKHLRFNQAPSTVFCLLAVLIGMGLLQTFARQAGSGREKPGPTRGDLVLTEDALPTELAGWTRTKFIPAPPVDELPKGQYWWVHQWQYISGESVALVSCDQLGEDHWHELTVCYRGLGWSIKNRTDCSSKEADGGPYVVAELMKESGERAILVFSVFYEDGTWAAAPSVDLSHLNGRRQEIGFGEQVWNRLTPIVTFGDSTLGHTRAIQCQVLVTGSEVDIKTELDSAIQLHLTSRKYFRREWLALEARSPAIH